MSPSAAPTADDEVRRYYANFRYRAQSWSKPRRVVAKVEWHPGELYPRVRFIITNLARSTVRVVAYYNQRDTAEQWIKVSGRGVMPYFRRSTLSDFSFMRRLITLTISCEPSRCPRRRSHGR
jgi:hypothetical protein